MAYLWCELLTGNFILLIEKNRDTLFGVSIFFDFVNPKLSLISWHGE